MSISPPSRELIKKYLLLYFGDTGLSGRIFRGSFGSLVIKMANAGLLFFTGVFLARLLGAEGYGVYAYALVVSRILSVPLMRGLQPLVVRYFSTYKARKEWHLMRGLLQKSHQCVLILALCLILVAGGIAWLMADKLDAEGLICFFVALTLLLIMPFLRLRESILRGLNIIVLAQVPDFIIRPGLFLTVVVLLFFAGSRDVSPGVAMGFHVLCALIALLIAFYISKRKTPKVVYTSIPDYEIKPWLRSILPLILIGLLQFLNKRTDIILLGVIKGPESVGIYQAVTRIAELIIFSLMAANMSLGPAIASLYAKKDLKKIQTLIRKSTNWVTIFFALPLFLGILFFGYWILLLFGPEFTQGTSALMILCGAQLINSALGTAGLILNMTGNERDSAWGMAIATVLNIILNLLLIPKYGLLGAACATGVSIITWKTIFVYFVYKRLGINCTIIKKINFI